MYFSFTDYVKAFVWITTNWKILKEMGIPDHRTCLLRNLYAGQEVTVKTGHVIMDQFKIGKGDMQSTSCKMPGWMNYKVESRFPGEISTTLDMQMMTSLWQKSKEELQSLLMKVKEEGEKAGLKFNIQKTKIMASDRIIPWQIDGEKMKNLTNFIFLGSNITTDSECNHEIKRHLLLGKKSYDKSRQCNKNQK